MMAKDFGWFPVAPVVSLIAGLVVAPNEPLHVIRSSPWQVGDTVVVRPPRGGAWRTVRTAEEMLRVEGPSTESQFGELKDVLALSSGGVAAFDMRGLQGPELLIFNSSGQLVRRLGRSGAGPGEYGGRANLGMLAEGPDGEIWQLDLGNRRINRWSREGKVLSAVISTVSFGPVMNIPLLRGPGGTMFVPAQVRADPKAPYAAHLHGAFRIRMDGRVSDTLKLPIPSQAPATPSVYAPRTLLHPLPTGGAVLLQTDIPKVTLSNETQRQEVRVELPIRAAVFDPRERAELTDLAQFQAAQMKQQPTPIPELKPLFARIQVGGEGKTVWLQQPAVGQPAPPGFSLALGGGAPTLNFVEPTRFIALRTNGIFLGEVRFLPVGIQRISFNANEAWGMVASADGSQTLVKWRLPN